MTVTIESETEVPFDFEYEQTAREVIAQAMDSEEFPYEAEVNLLLVDNDIIHELNLEYGHSPKREFAFLITHSMLHLFGYDHMEPEEAAIMENKQEKILEVLGISR